MALDWFAVQLPLAVVVPSRNDVISRVTARKRPRSSSERIVSIRGACGNRGADKNQSQDNVI